MLPGDYQHVVQKLNNLERPAFEAWLLEGGTLEKASAILAKRGIVNGRTKKAYTPMGIQQAAYRYIIYNHEEVRPVMENLWKEYNVGYVNDETWEKYIVNMASIVLGNSSKGRFLKWLEDNPKFKKYEYMYAIKYGIEADRRTEV